MTERLAIHAAFKLLECPRQWIDAMTEVSRETHERLEVFAALLRRWSSSLNLVSKTDLSAGLWTRHICASLALLPHIPDATTRFIDLGSGGGLPAIPVAIATGMFADLVESDQRKAAFLETALATLAISGKVWATRIEDCDVAPAQCITARALAPLSTLLHYTHPLLDPGGAALFLKGNRAEAEITEARRSWRMDVDILSIDTNGSRVLKISRLEPLHEPDQ